MNTLRKAFLFISAPLIGFLLPPFVLGLISIGPSAVLVPFEAWILMGAVLLLSILTAFAWSRYIYPRLHHRIEQDYRAKWQKGELMTASAFLISALILGLLYRPCMFNVEPYCRGVFPAIDILVKTVSNSGLDFTSIDQSASAVIGSYTGFVITFTILLDEIVSRILFYSKHRK